MRVLMSGAGFSLNQRASGSAADGKAWMKRGCQVAVGSGAGHRAAQQLDHGGHVTCLEVGAGDVQVTANGVEHP